MAGIRVEGNASGNVGEVDVNHNTFVNPPLVNTQSGFVSLTSEVDPGVVLGSRLMRNLELTAEQRLRVAFDTPLLSAQFPGAAVDTSIWFQGATTMTIVQGSQYLTLNNSSIVTAIPCRSLSSPTCLLRFSSSKPTTPTRSLA